MRAAIYARKSTKQERRDDADKSVTRQVERARSYATTKGWTVAEEHVFVDDGISGAEFENRPGFERLIASLPKRRKPPFDVLIMSEASRLGRDQQRNGYYFALIRDAGVRIYYYLDDAEEKLDTPEQVLMSNVKSYASEVERIKAGQRSRDALERKARLGFNTGGVVYGYQNVQVMGASGKRSHTDYRIDDSQAEIIRAIFRMYADGHGLTKLAKALNGEPRYRAEALRYFLGERPEKPIVGKRGTGTWSPTSIREMLHNERYTGRVPFGQYRKVYRGGTKGRVRAGDPQYAERPDLRIVDQDLWEAVQLRFKAIDNTFMRAPVGGTLLSRPEAARESRYLLSGIARCSCCNGGMTATGIPFGSGKTRRLVPHYMCSYRSKRGTAVCTNNLRERAESLEQRVVGAIEATALQPAVVDLAIDHAFEVARRQIEAEPDRAARIQAEIEAVRRELDNYVAAIAKGADLPELVVQVRTRRDRIAALQAELQGITAAAGMSTDEIADLKGALRERMGYFKDLLYRDVPLARQALRKLLTGPVQCIPVISEDRRGYAVRGETSLGALLVPTSTSLASPRGFEPRLPP